MDVAPTSEEDLASKVRAVVDTLPQRSVIPDEVAERWIQGIIKRDPDRAVWHAERAKGIGGSEIGELVLHASGNRTTYSTLEEISRQKLLLDLPTRENIYMARGTGMEPLAEKTYRTITGHKSILDRPDIQEGFAQGHPLHSWLVGNPDEVVDAKKLGRVITDFKVRSNLDREEDINLVNACQVHWYGIIHEGRFGKLPDGYGLAELDIPSQMIDSLLEEDSPDFDALANTIASVDKPGFGMQIRYFKHNPALASHMTRLADQFWNNHVMKGKPFNAPKAEKPADLTKDDEKKIEDNLNELVRFKIAESVSKASSDKIREDLFETAGRYEMKEWPFEVPGLSCGYTTSFDSSKAATELLAAGVKRETIAGKSKTLDTDAALLVLENNGLLDETLFKPSWDARKIKKALKEQGMDSSQFEGTRFRAGISTKKADKPVKELLEAKMGNHIQSFSPSAPAPVATQNSDDEPAFDAFEGMDDDDLYDDEQAELKLG